jgi:uncharacterized FAD-dependent dehydrogenase
MLRLHEIKLGLNEPVEKLEEKIVKRLDISASELLTFSIYKESVDARNKDDIKLVYSVDIEVRNEKALLKQGAKMKLEKAAAASYVPVASGGAKLAGRPVVVGFGPCGMFAALLLSERGYRPIVIERGKPIEDRLKDVTAFWTKGELNTESNVQFGEGGAGAFSDGKLTTQIKDKRVRKVLQELVLAGGPGDILYRQKPHIGTDVLREVVLNMRKKIQQNGGEIRFESKLTKIDKNIITVNNTEDIQTGAVILAIGHSARDTVEMLYQSGMVMEQKAFSIGLRVEHPQRMIDEVQYGSAAGHPRLGAAEYKLSHHCSDGRGVYTFCMCPGGHVIGAASEEGGVVTNGMSFHNRAAANANSAILVDVRPEDFDSNHPLDGIAFQRRWEREAFKAGQSSYKAPAQKIGDFLKQTSTKSGGVIKATYMPGVVWTNLDDCLPAFASRAIREALPVYGSKLKGFDDPEGILTGVESRSSSPVRIKRSVDFCSSIEGYYPAGEGAGYAGGIVSAAVDGLKAAEEIIRKYAAEGVC